MSEDTKLREEIARADRAKAILDDPVVQQAFTQIEDSILRAWESTPGTEKDKLAALHSLYVAARKFRNTLASTLQTGKMASLQLEEKRKFRLWSAN